MPWLYHSKVSRITKFFGAGCSTTYKLHEPTAWDIEYRDSLSDDESDGDTDTDASEDDELPPELATNYRDPEDKSGIAMRIDPPAMDPRLVVDDGRHGEYLKLSVNLVLVSVRVRCTRRAHTGPVERHCSVTGSGH
jgi:hypothetical protein